MSAPSPLVSVVLPTFNRMAFLPTTVQSVVDQTFDDWELIVVDDGSTDHTRRYLSGLQDGRVRCILLEHTANPSRVRNTAIRHARGRYVAFVDSDDTWKPRKLELQIAALRSVHRCRWSYTATERIDETGRPLGNAGVQQWVPYDGWILERLIRLDALIALPSVVIERELLEQVGGFNETMLYCEDYDLWFRVAARSPVCVLPEPLACVRTHAASYSSNRLAVHQSWVRLYTGAAERTTDRRLRRLCTARRVAHLALVSRIHTARRENRLALRTLLGAASYAWAYPEWWRSLGRAAVRPLVPAPVVAAVRRWRGRVATRTAA